MVTVLECTAEDCTYNKHQCCCKGEIQVEGLAAEKARDTCCGSFVAKSDNVFSNSCGCKSPSRTIEIGCDVDACTYNNDKKCYAERIGISGPGAEESGQTQCSTFKRRA